MGQDVEIAVRPTRKQRRSWHLPPVRPHFLVSGSDPGWTWGSAFRVASSFAPAVAQ